MKKNLRVGALINELVTNPCVTYSMEYFCKKFDVAKSSLSEDVDAANEAMSILGNGEIRTSPGVGGGIKYVPGISDEECRIVQSELARRLSEPKRILGGGFLYTNDILYDSHLVYKMAQIFSRKFANLDADYIVTVETKGIPLASAVSFVLNIPLVVIRREAKYAEGATVSINYFSGSYDRIQRMSISKLAVKFGKTAIIIDDFMRGGGSLKGISEILAEFNISVAAIGVATVQRDPSKKRVSSYFPLTILENIDEKGKTINVSINDFLADCK